MTKNIYPESPRSAGLDLNLGWLRTVCSEFILKDGTDQPNPNFNPGIRARLRRGLDRPGAAHEDARLIGYLTSAGLDTEKHDHVLPFQLVCAIYAWHPHALIPANDVIPAWRRRSSFGQVCRAIAIKQEEKTTGARPTAVDPQNNTFTARFERLVHCRTLDKMFVPMRSIVKMLASSGSEIPIDFHRLVRDLYSWESTWSRENGARMNWMLDYWRADREPIAAETAETAPT